MAPLKKIILCIFASVSVIAASTLPRHIIDGQIWDGIPSRKYNPFEVPDYAPAGFATPYNLSYCPAGSTEFPVPPIIAYYVGNPPINRTRGK